jgi:hypothetical protein
MEKKEHVIHYDLEIMVYPRWTNHNMTNIGIVNSCERIARMVDEKDYDKEAELDLSYNKRSPTIGFEFGEGQYLRDISFCPFCGAKFTFVQRKVKKFKEVTKKKITPYTIMEEVKE